MDNGAEWLTYQNGLFKVRAASAAERPQGWSCIVLVLPYVTLGSAHGLFL